MLANIKSAFLLLLLLTIVTGVIYPLTMTGISAILFPRQAGGSLIAMEDKIIGSSLIGQNFTQAKYFHPRPSAAGKGYDPMATLEQEQVSTSVELVPSSDLFKIAIKKKVQQLQREFQHNNGLIPIDLVTRSASGLDPDISPAAAIFQSKHIAAVRGLTEAQVLALIDKHTTIRQFGIFGEPRVNVLALNMALDEHDQNIRSAD